MIGPEYYHLTYYHAYRLYIYQPDLAPIYEAAHFEIKRDPLNGALKEALGDWISNNALKDRRKPNDYQPAHWKKALNAFKASGVEIVPRDKGYEMRGFRLSAFHQMRMHQFRPHVGLRYGRLHDRLALDNQNDSIVEEIIDLIDMNELRSVPIPFGYDVEEMQRMMARLLRVNREKDLEGEL